MRPAYADCDGHRARRSGGDGALQSLRAAEPATAAAARARPRRHRQRPRVVPPSDLRLRAREHEDGGDLPPRADRARARRAALARQPGDAALGAAHRGAVLHAPAHLLDPRHDERRPLASRRRSAQRLLPAARARPEPRPGRRRACALREGRGREPRLRACSSRRCCERSGSAIKNRNNLVRRGRDRRERDRHAAPASARDAARPAARRRAHPRGVRRRLDAVVVPPDHCSSTPRSRPTSGPTPPAPPTGCASSDRRSGIAPHSRTDAFLQLAQPLSIILRAIEFDAIPNAEALYAGPYTADMLTLITQWSIATGQNLKDPMLRAPITDVVTRPQVPAGAPARASLMPA